MRIGEHRGNETEYRVLSATSINTHDFHQGMLISDQKSYGFDLVRARCYAVDSHETAHAGALEERFEGEWRRIAPILSIRFIRRKEIDT